MKKKIIIYGRSGRNWTDYDSNKHNGYPYVEIEDYIYRILIILRETIAAQEKILMELKDNEVYPS